MVPSTSMRLNSFDIGKDCHFGEMTTYENTVVNKNH